MTVSGPSKAAAVILRGDARNLPLPDASVDLIVTSPPYFGLRSYQDGGEHYAGQIGAEATPEEFINALLECTREWMRVLKPEGSLWLNLGDKYSGWAGDGPQDGLQGGRPANRNNGQVQRRKAKTSIPAKSLMGLPWRYALGCIDDLGLILRAEVIWSKPSAMPESVTDRVRRSHEQWFHLVKQRNYFTGVDEIREPHIYPNDTRHLRGGRRSITPEGSPGGGNTSNGNPLGKLPSSVWEIATQPLKVPADLGLNHFAAFPLELPRRIILGWSPAGICVECGQGRRPVIDKDRRILNGSFGQYALAHGADGRTGRRAETTAAITSYACACPEQTAPTQPAVVLDPFGGTGTTALVASVLGRRGISVDRSADYCRIAQWRTTDPGERARALGVPKPPVQVEGQADLFGEVVS